MSHVESDPYHAALQREWSTVLWARIEALSLDPTIGHASDLVHRAWADCAARHPALRRLLDAHRDERVA
jgi:hypothetical protein